MNAEPALGDVALLAVAAQVVDGDGVAGARALPVDHLLGAQLVPQLPVGRQLSRFIRERQVRLAVVGNFKIFR